MSTFISNLVHFVWGTADREPLIRKSWRNDLHAYMGGIMRNKKATLLAAGGIEDHMHALVSLPATVTLYEIAAALKANSSRWVHDNVPQGKGFDWQTGYGAFSVSKSQEERVKEYIGNQEEHHRQWRFTEEFKALLERHEIPYEERYLWV
jgi:REP-associated tyrosine transposase